MKVDRYGRLVRWAYWGEASVPFQTSLCVLFWRTVLWTPLKGATLLLVGGGLLYLVGDAIWVTKGAVIVIGALAGWTLYALIWFLPRTFRRLADSTERSVVWQGAKAVKGRMCPIVELER